jgi:CheY-like chemotaxis protein
MSTTPGTSPGSDAQASSQTGLKAATHAAADTASGKRPPSVGMRARPQGASSKSAVDPSFKHLVFLVDDDTKHLMLLKDHLERYSIYPLEIKLFSSGENCMEKMHEQPSVVVLDYHLDGIRPDAANGLEILKQIRDGYPDTDVIMMSAQDQLEVGLLTLEHGAADYAIKGETAFLRAEFALRRLLERRAAERYSAQQRQQLRMLYGILVLLAIALVALAMVAI